MLAGALRTYLSRNWDTAVEIVGLARIAGGASRETWRFDALVDGAVRPLILRRDPGGSLIETERALEFSALKTVYGRLPVPEPLILESGGRELERPFFIMARIDGGLVPSPIQPDPYGEHASVILPQSPSPERRSPRWRPVPDRMNAGVSRLTIGPA
jgi:aminoglycoside phosphotransferase (APT) family kinase protein